MADGLVNEEALKELLERAAGALRPLGLTVFQASFGMDPEAGGTYLQMVLQVRDSAADGVQESIKDKEAFNQMMADEHQLTMDKQKQEIIDALSNDDALEDALFSEDEDDE